MAMGCLAGCKKSLSWTDPLNHKKRADNFSARFLFSDSPQLYFPTTSLPELEPAAGNELPFPLSPPLSTHHSRLSGFPFLLLMTHPFVHSTNKTESEMKSQGRWYYPQWWTGCGGIWFGKVHHDDILTKRGQNELWFGAIQMKKHRLIPADKGKRFFWGGRGDGKECWNEILFETQSFPPRLTVKYILAPVRKRNDKCKKQRERENSGKDYIWKQNDETVYFISNYYSTKGMNFFDIKSPSSKNIEEADEEVFVILFLCWWTRFGLWVLHSLLWSFVVILFLCWWKRCGCSTPKGRRALNVPLLVTLTDRPPGLPTWKIYSHKSQTYFSPFLTILI